MPALQSPRAPRQLGEEVAGVLGVNGDQDSRLCGADDIQEVQLAGVTGGLNTPTCARKMYQARSQTGIAILYYDFIAGDLGAAPAAGDAHHGIGL